MRIPTVWTTRPTTLIPSCFPQINCVPILFLNPVNSVNPVSTPHQFLPGPQTFLPATDTPCAARPSDNDNVVAAPEPGVKRVTERSPRWIAPNNPQHRPTTPNHARRQIGAHPNSLDYTSNDLIPSCFPQINCVPILFLNPVNSVNPVSPPHQFLPGARTFPDRFPFKHPHSPGLKGRNVKAWGEASHRAKPQVDRPAIIPSTDPRLQTTPVPKSVRIQTLWTTRPTPLIPPLFSPHQLRSHFDS